MTNMNVCDYAALNAALHKNEKKKKYFHLATLPTVFTLQLSTATALPRDSQHDSESTGD